MLEFKNEEEEEVEAVSETEAKKFALCRKLSSEAKHNC